MCGQKNRVFFDNNHSKGSQTRKKMGRKLISVVLTKVIEKQ